MKFFRYISFAVVCVLLACEHTPYDTGDGTYSHLHTDYVTVKVHDDHVQSIVTDEGRSLAFSKGMTYDVQPVDTTLRWLLYYNKVNDSAPIEIVGRTTMWLLKTMESYEVAPMKTDPVTVTGVWVAKNGKYLNMRLGLKTGNSDNKAKQTVILVKDGVNDDVAYYTLYHDQAGILQYYTQEYFFTVEIPEQKVIDLTINTYNGTWHKQLIIDN